MKNNMEVIVGFMYIATDNFLSAVMRPLKNESI